MTNAEKYAQRLQRNYGIEQVPVSLDDKTFDTIGKIAAEVLPADKYQQWEKDLSTRTNNLRVKYSIEGRV